MYNLLNCFPFQKKSNLNIAVISITPEIEFTSNLKMENIYKSIGKNTGNLVFTQSIYKQLLGNVQRIEFSFIPEEINRMFDVVVIPASNWLNMYSDWQFLCNLLEKIKIPVITIGIGIQKSNNQIFDFNVHPSSIRLAKLLSRKSSYISCRGDFTKLWLKSIGIKNVISTGCPSLYWKQNVSNTNYQGNGLVIQSTRYRLSSSFINSKGINRLLYHLAGNLDVDIVYQSEPEEIEQLLFGFNKELISKPSFQDLISLYGFSDIEKLESFINAHGKIFFDTLQWTDYLSRKAGLIGTRLHGTILALNVGIPAILIAHDSRTSELISFAKIPTISDEKLNLDLDESALTDMLNSVSLKEYIETRSKNLTTYLDFLSLNGLKPNRNNIVD